MRDNDVYPFRFWGFPAMVVALRSAPPCAKPSLTTRDADAETRCFCGKPRAYADAVPLCVEHYREYRERQRRGKPVSADELRVEYGGRPLDLVAD